MPTDTELVPVSAPVSAPISEFDISQRVYIIRGEKVMLDRDLAEIYGYTTRKFNEQVKNNIERFDSDFMFQLTQGEVDDLRSKNRTANISSKSRYLPYVFTEQGIYMLASVLKGSLAVEQSKTLIRVFKKMREYIQQNPMLITQAELKAITARQDRTDERLDALQKTVDELGRNFISGENIQEFIILNGQKFEADVALYQHLCTGKGQYLCCG